MKIARALALFALALTVVPAALFAAGIVEDGTMKAAMLIGVVLWFATAPKWLHGATD